MKTYNCEICKEIKKAEDTYIQHEGEGKIGLYCSQCNDWIRWISHDEEMELLSAGSMLKELDGGNQKENNEKECTCCKEHECNCEKKTDEYVIERLKELSEYLQAVIDSELGTLSKDAEDAVRKGAKVFAYREMKQYVDNIAEGKDFLKKWLLIKV